MSKNISIKVGGVSRNFSNVPKIQTKEVGTGDSIDWIPQDEANDYAITETLRVTENGTYHPSSGKCGFNEVNVRVSGGAGTLIEKTITQNGEYYAMDDEADGYSKVTVNVSAPITYLTQAEYDALTLEEKIALGFIIIRDSQSQLTGVWYDYTQASTYVIPYSNLQNIIVYSEASSFDGINPWGTGTKPVSYDPSYVTYDTATASVNVPARTDGDQASAVADIELPEIGTSEVYTVYGVCACDISATTFGYVVAVYGNNSATSCPVVACDGRDNLYRLQCGTHQVDRDTPYVAMQSRFFACAMKINRQTGKCKIFINDYVSDELLLNTTEVYRYIMLASSQGMGQNTDCRYKFIGCVNGLETDTVVENNIAHLRLVYGI